MAYMLKYDTVHGRFKGTVTHTADSVVVNGKAIRVFNSMKVRCVLRCCAGFVQGVWEDCVWVCKCA